MFANNNLDFITFLSYLAKRSVSFYVNEETYSDEICIKAL